jgi:predicted lipid-binding transport protein (Tim44 family)
VALITCGLFLQTAEAKRFGGGKSFGYNRSFSNSQHANRTPTPAPQSTPARNKWLAPLAGLAAGGLLASLFMGHGMGSGILSWILIGAAAFFIWRLISRFKSQARPMPMQQALQSEPVAHFTPTETLHNTSYTPTPATSGFDESAFLRTAKTTFIRLQAAYDHNNLSDIRQFTAPEVFAEIQMQLQERHDAPNQTDVIEINARLLDLDIESDKLTASVNFSGLIREESNAQPIEIKEIWHFTKLKSAENWLLAGIQQQS